MQGAFLYSQIAALNYRRRGWLLLPMEVGMGGEARLGDKRGGDWKHLSSCRLLTPLCLQSGNGAHLDLSPFASPLLPGRNLTESLPVRTKARTSGIYKTRRLKMDEMPKGTRTTSLKCREVDLHDRLSAPHRGGGKT